MRKLIFLFRTLYIIRIILISITNNQHSIMKRIALTDGTGQWFDEDKAEVYNGVAFHDGRNWISKATGSQWEHESIYVTKSGKFILNHYSNLQGSRETYELISKEDAAAWFAKQGFSDDDIPKIFRKEVADLEIL